jgi:hypothetical protein
MSATYTWLSGATQEIDTMGADVLAAYREEFFARLRAPAARTEPWPECEQCGCGVSR